METKIENLRIDNREMELAKRPITIKIICCRGCGYKSQATTFRKQIARAFPKEKFVWVLKTTDQVNGCFEVLINGEQVHSKLEGDGYVDSADKMKVIEDRISGCLKQK
ncbi:selenoprotein W-like [Symsagittifera roscoffensis]|uniref:selenoprotein W-like n=1 Tax=Symsagittifera roscoffensis TaxID=84072 RepID=UPI00307BED5A